MYGAGRDIEWAFAGGQLYLLQCRAVTVSAGAAAQLAPAVRRSQASHSSACPSSQISPGPIATPSRDCSPRVFAPGETVTRRVGSCGVLPHRIGHSNGDRARCVSTDLASRRPLREIALIDGRARSATVTADGQVVCQGITLWDFQPLVQRNPTIAWTLLQTLARQLREASDA